MIKMMGKFTAIGMRKKVVDDNAIIINTCGKNDTAEAGTWTSWVWCNPTNRALIHHYEDISAVSVECLWQGTKILRSNTTGRPDPLVLGGDWRRGKGRAPRGAYAGPGADLITDVGEARRRIYIPAFRALVEHWLKSEEVRGWVERCREFDGPVFLRDHDTGRGVNRNGPMSHAWLLCEYLNTGAWPVA